MSSSPFGSDAANVFGAFLVFGGGLQMFQHQGNIRGEGGYVREVRLIVESAAAGDHFRDVRVLGPDILRVAPMPLYNTYREVHRFADRFLAAID